APDVSPLIDHPWLLRCIRHDRLSSRATLMANEATRVVNECEAIRSATSWEAGQAGERFRQLCDLYRNHDAREKELETAWLWLVEMPDAVSSWHAVARAHSRPGEEFELLSVCGRAKARGLELDDLDAAYERALERIGGRP